MTFSWKWIDTNIKESLWKKCSSSQKSQFYKSIVLAALCFFFVFGFVSSITFPLDDAYITLHNAEVLITGWDKNYVGSAALVGATSAVHLVLVTALTLLFPPLVAAYIASAAAIIIYALGLAKLAFEMGGSRALVMIALIIGLFSGFQTYHLLNGLETGLAMAAVSWALVLAYKSKPTWHLPLICGVMPFIRPELSVLSALLLAHQAHLRIKNKLGNAIVIDLLAVVLAVAPWLILFKLNTGQFFPGTISAKAAFFSEKDFPASIKLQLMLGLISPMTLLTGFAAFVVTPRYRLTIFGSLFAVAIYSAYWIFLPGALHHNWYRYIQILAPVSVFALLSLAKVSGTGRRILLLLLFITPFTLTQAIEIYFAGRRATTNNLESVANWANQNLPKDAKILIHDAGYIAYATDFQLIDIVGLKTPNSIPIHQEITAPSLGMNRSAAIHQIALEARPTHAIVQDDIPRFWGSAIGALIQHGWTVKEVNEPRS